MFDEVIKKEGARRLGRQGIFLLGSSALQIALVVGVVLVAAVIKARVADEPVVPVKFVKAATAPAPVPTAPASPQPALVRRRTNPVSRPATALIQPRKMPETEIEHGADPTEPEEPPVAEGRAEAAGGPAAAQPSPPPPPPPPKQEVREEPAYAGVGFTRPHTVEKNCVQAGLHIPRGLEGFVSTVTVKFAIAKDGTPSLFQVQPPAPDARLTSAIWQAVQACRWVAGTNPQGKPTKIWVVMPFRFQAS